MDEEANTPVIENTPSTWDTAVNLEVKMMTENMKF